MQLILLVPARLLGYSHPPVLTWQVGTAGMGTVGKRVPEHRNGLMEVVQYCEEVVGGDPMKGWGKIPRVKYVTNSGSWMIEVGLKKRNVSVGQ